MSDSPAINSITGEPQSPSGWSQDDPTSAAATAPRNGAAALAPQSPFAQSAVPKPYQDESAAYARKAEADKAAWAEREATWAPIKEKLQRELLAGNPPPPDQQRLPAPPSVDPQRYQQNAMAFVGVMAVLGALSGKFTRNAGNASLNAFAGAVNGWKQGNLDAYQQKSKEWEDTTKQMLENNRMVLDKYKAILENKSLNIEQQMMAAKLVASEYQDSIAFNALEANNYTMFAQLYDKQTGAQDKAVELFLKLSGDKRHETEQNQAKARQLETPEGQAWMQGLDPASRMKLQGFLKVYGSGAPPLGTGANLADATLEEMVDRRLAGDKSVLQNLGRGTQGSANISAFNNALAQAMQQRGMSGADLAKIDQQYVGDTAYQRGAGNSAQRIENATNEVVQLIPQALETSAALPRGSWVPINLLIQKFEAGTSDPKYYDFSLANFSLMNAYARAMNPQGVPRIQERLEAHAAGVLSQATDQASYKIMVERLWKEVQASKKAVAQTREGRSPGDVNAPMPGSDTAPANDGWGEVTVH